MTKPHIVLILNLALGNLILTNSILRNEDNFLVSTAVSALFSAIAYFTIRFFLKKVKAKPTWSRAALCSGLLTLVVPVIGMFFYFLVMSLNQSEGFGDSILKALILGVLTVLGGLYVGLPMFILNTFLFKWATKANA